MGLGRRWWGAAAQPVSGAPPTPRLAGWSKRQQNRQGPAIQKWRLVACTGWRPQWTHLRGREGPAHGRVGAGAGHSLSFPTLKRLLPKLLRSAGAKIVGSVGWKGVNYASLPLANRKQVRSGLGTGLGARSLSQTRGISQCTPSWRPLPHQHTT